MMPSFDEVDAALVNCRIGMDASELHGLAVGFIAGGGSLESSDWMARLQVEADATQVAKENALQALRRSAKLGLEDDEFGFDLLLPDESALLGDRIDALFAWCRGFLAGYALVPNRATLSEDAQEAFEDLAGIASFVVDDEDQDEDALIEVAEFARVAALLIHGDARNARSQASSRLH